jgi:hypothetical protein
MFRLTAMPDVSFRTKVLVPMIVVMVLIVTISMWLANQQLKEQIQKSASQQMKSAGTMLKITQQNREKELLRRYGNAKSEPRFKAATRMFEPGQCGCDCADARPGCAGSCGARPADRSAGI